MVKSSASFSTVPMLHRAADGSWQIEQEILRGSRFLLWMDMLHRSQSFAQNQLLKFLHQIFPIAVFLALDDRTLFRHRSQEFQQMAWKRLSCVLALASPELFYFFPLQEQKQHYLWVGISAPLWEKCWKQGRSGKTPETLSDLSRHQSVGIQSLKLKADSLKILIF